MNCQRLCINKPIVLPDALKGALQGKGADAAGKYLKQLTKPSLKTPMKRG
ncbi:hypothetical protein [Carnobacterium divergens]|nr:hypothetical protein [Carnobacterium divergens]